MILISRATEGGERERDAVEKGNQTPSRSQRCLVPTKPSKHTAQLLSAIKLSQQFMHINKYLADSHAQFCLVQTQTETINDNTNLIKYELKTIGMLYNTIFPAKYMNFDMQGVHLDLSICDTSYLHLLHQKNSCRGSRRPALRRKPTDSCGSGSAACGRRCCLHPCSWWTWHRGSACPCLQPGRSERMLWCWDCGRWAEFRVQSALKHHLKCGFVLGSSAGERSASTDLPGVCSISVRSAQWSCRLSSSYLISNTCRRGRRRSLAPFLASSPANHSGLGVSQCFNAPPGAWALPRDTANVCVCGH